MKILVIDDDRPEVDFVLRCQQHGHEVRVFIKTDPKTESVGKGIIRRVSDWRDHMRWADLVFVCNNVLYLKELEGWRRAGVPIFAPTVEAAQLEIDRGAGQDFLERHGIKVPASEMFSDYDAAIAYVKKTGMRCVSKPNGDADKALSYCSASPADMVYMLERWKKSAKLKDDFILQEFIPGIEMAVGGWFGPGGFNAGWCENFEFKKMFNDDKGIATGEQGTALRYTRKSKLAQKVLAPLADSLEKMGYIGYIDVNCIIDEKGTPWPLEFTCRPGYPTFNIQQALLAGDPAEWMLDLIEGRDTAELAMDKVAVGVVVTMPPYPYHNTVKSDTVGVPIYGLKLDSLDWRDTTVSPCEVMKGEAPAMDGDKVTRESMALTAGAYVMTVTGVGATVEEARRRAYGRIRQLSMPNSPQYRTDIGRKLAKELPRLHEMGYAEGMDYV